MGGGSAGIAGARPAPPRPRRRALAPPRVLRRPPTSDAGTDPTEEEEEDDREAEMTAGTGNDEGGGGTTWSAPRSDEPVAEILAIAAGVLELTVDVTRARPSPGSPPTLPLFATLGAATTYTLLPVPAPEPTPPG